MTTSTVMPDLITHFAADRECIQRMNAAPYSPLRRTRLRKLHADYTEQLERIPFEEIGRDDQADWLLLRNLLESTGRDLDREERLLAEAEPLIPFVRPLIEMEDARRRMEDVDPPSAAALLNETVAAVTQTRKSLEARPESGATPAVACRAAVGLDGIRKSLANWYGFHNAFDPLFTWWVGKPYEALDHALEEYAGFLRKEVAKADSPDAIVGDPIGRDALLEEIRRAWIPYTPEELVAIAQREMEWCRAELVSAAREMGCGDDWRIALERVKQDHVPPGAQPALVRDLAREAIAYVQANDLVTVPPLAAECWRMEMMPPDRQKVNPFFLGGEEIIVSFPTHEMEHAQKQMSLRGNNRHFARATVQHELIPGHHLQGFSQERNRPYRRIFYTPFWTEGWTLHWEMLLWDLGFPRTPEERIGMLFWRSHRCARVVFSLGFHLGQMTAQECVEMLVSEVGHERDNAEAEVRRSFGGDYDPLYQAAYLLGGMQVHRLHGELVGSGRMTHRQFHDTVLQENCMPIALLRAILTDAPLDRGFRGDWRFAG